MESKSLSAYARLATFNSFQAALVAALAMGSVNTAFAAENGAHFILGQTSTTTQTLQEEDSLVVNNGWTLSKDEAPAIVIKESDTLIINNGIIETTNADDPGLDSTISYLCDACGGGGETLLSGGGHSIVNLPKGFILNTNPDDSASAISFNGDLVDGEDVLSGDSAGLILNFGVIASESLNAATIMGGNDSADGNDSLVLINIGDISNANGPAIDLRNNAGGGQLMLVGGTVDDGDTQVGVVDGDILMGGDNALIGDYSFFPILNGNLVNLVGSTVQGGIYSNTGNLLVALGNEVGNSQDMLSSLLDDVLDRVTDGRLIPNYFLSDISEFVNSFELGSHIEVTDDIAELGAGILTLEMNAGESGTVTIGGDINIDGDITISSGTNEVEGTVLSVANLSNTDAVSTFDQNVTANGDVSNESDDISGATLTIGGNLTIATADDLVNENDFSYSGEDIFSVSDTTLTVDGTTTLAGGDIDNYYGTMTLTGDVDLGEDGDVFNTNGDLVFGNDVLDGDMVENYGEDGHTANLIVGRDMMVASIDNEADSDNSKAVLTIGRNLVVAGDIDNEDGEITVTGTTSAFNIYNSLESLNHPGEDAGTATFTGAVTVDNVAHNGVIQNTNGVMMFNNNVSTNFLSNNSDAGDFDLGEDEVLPTALIDITGTLTMTNGGDITNSGGTLNVHGTTTASANNTNILNQHGGIATFTGAVSLNGQNGNITNETGGDLLFEDSVTAGAVSNTDATLSFIFEDDEATFTVSSLTNTLDDGEDAEDALITISGGEDLTITDDIINNGGQINVYNMNGEDIGTLSVGDELNNNSGKMVVYRSLEVANALTNTNGGFFEGKEDALVGSLTNDDATMIFRGDLGVGEDDLLNVNGAVLTVYGDISVDGYVENEDAKITFYGDVDTSFYNEGNSVVVASPGTHTIDGDFTQDDDGELDMTVVTNASSSTLNSRLVVDGDFTLAEGLLYLDSGTHYIKNGAVYTIATVGGDIDVEDTVVTSSNPNRISYTLSIEDDVVYATATRISPFQTLGNYAKLTTGAGKALELLGHNSPSSELLVVLDALDSQPTLAASQNLLKELSPNTNGGTLEGSQSAQNVGVSTVSDRLDDLHAELDLSRTGMNAGDPTAGIGSWARAFGGNVKQKERSGFDGYDLDTYGFAIGFDHKRASASGDLTVGLSANYARTKVDSADGAIQPSETKIKSYQANMYGSLERGRNLFDGMVAYTRHNYESKRHIPTLSDTALGDFSGNQFLVKGSMARVFKSSGFEMTPVLSAMYSHLTQEAYTETGAGVENLSVEEANSDRLQTRLGVRLARPFTSKRGDRVIPEVHAAWMYDVLDDTQQTTAAFTVGGPSFDTEGAKQDRSSANVGLGVSVLTQNRFTFTVNYDAELKDKYVGQYGNLMVRYEY